MVVSEPKVWTQQPTWHKILRVLRGGQTHHHHHHKEEVSGELN